MTYEYFILAFTAILMLAVVLFFFGMITVAIIFFLDNRQQRKFDKELKKIYNFTEK